MSVQYALPTSSSHQPYMFCLFSASAQCCCLKISKSRGVEVFARSSLLMLATYNQSARSSCWPLECWASTRVLEKTPAHPAACTSVCCRVSPETICLLNNLSTKFYPLMWRRMPLCMPCRPGSPRSATVLSPAARRARVGAPRAPFPVGHLPPAGPQGPGGHALAARQRLWRARAHVLGLVTLV